jgi:hypothetical protein
VDLAVLRRLAIEGSTFLEGAGLEARASIVLNECRKTIRTTPIILAATLFRNG